LLHFVTSMNQLIGYYGLAVVSKELKIFCEETDIAPRSCIKRTQDILRGLGIGVL